MDSRLRRFPPDRASAVSYGQTVGNATRCPPLAHRSAAAHKLHSAQSNRYKIRESQNQIPGTGLSLFLPGDCPNDRDHRSAIPGIWLREGEVKGETRLVLPSLTFDLRESLEFINEGRRYLLTPIDLEESGSNYEIGRYRESVLD
jgi:hypothetical protein